MKSWYNLTPEQRSKRSIHCAIGSFIIAVLLTAYVIYANAQADKIKKECTMITSGKVISTHPVSKYNFQNHLTAKYEVNGTEYYAEGNYSSDYSYGSTVSVYYDKDNPSRAYACDAPTSPQMVVWVFTIAVFAVGGFLFIKQSK